MRLWKPGALFAAGAGLALLLLARCNGQNAATAGQSYGPPVRLAQLQNDAIDESSGLAASRRADNLLWTHNDSGGGPRLYATDRRGRSLATFRVTGAKARDWEDIASGPGPGGPALYIGDIGDNMRRRHDTVVYRVPEPRVDLSQTGVAGRTAPAERFPYRYPDGHHDAESLIVHPKTGEIFIVTKGEEPAKVYRFPQPLQPGRTVTLKRVTALSGVPGGLTAGDIAPDGRRAVLRDYLVAYEYRLPPGKPFAAIFREMPEPILLALERQGEAIAYRRDGRALLTTSEGRRAPLHELLMQRRVTRGE